MRPLNTRDRRIQFTRFLLLFLLAVLPIVVLVWLHGRVDHAENDFLRKQYSSKLIETQDKEKFDRALEAVIGRADDLLKELNARAGDLTQMSGRRAEGEIKNKNADLEKAIVNFQPYTAAGGANKAVSDMANALRDCANVLQEVYKEGYGIVGARDGDLKRCKEDLEDVEKKFKDCETSARLNSN